MNTINPLTAADLFQIGHWIQWQDHLFEITGWDAHTPLQVEARSADTGIVHQFTLTELFNPGHRRNSPLAGVNSKQHLLTTFTPSSMSWMLPLCRTLSSDMLTALFGRWKQCRYRLTNPGNDTCSPVNHLLTEATRQACQALFSPVSLSNYYLYRRIYQANGGDRALIAASRRPAPMARHKLTKTHSTSLTPLCAASTAPIRHCVHKRCITSPNNCGITTKVGG